jgi:hypothetical protein
MRIDEPRRLRRKGKGLSPAARRHPVLGPILIGARDPE